MNYLPDIEQRFIRYAQIDTQSDPFATNKVPSTDKQYDLLNLLKTELEQLGATDVILTDYAAVIATIPATIKNSDNIPVVALFAHVDTSPDFSGENVKPLIHRNYNGQPLILPDDPTQIINSDNSPYLSQKIGDDIITASGTTLLGADDKAGVAVLMTLAKVLLENAGIPHGNIRLCFTPDEEIGHGVTHLKLQDLNADVAYTLDGGILGEVTYESFSADACIIKITGVSTHPGYAKGKMVNAINLIGDLITRLAQHPSPAETAGKEGFIHLGDIQGNNVTAELRLILRDFELDGLADKRTFVENTIVAVQAAEPRATITHQFINQYRNMRYWLEEDMRPVELAREAAQACGILPIDSPIRGGTDGSRLTERGLPTPNLFTGMQNFHGPLEWVSLQDMGKAVEMCLKLVELWGNSAEQVQNDK